MAEPAGVLSLVSFSLVSSVSPDLLSFSSSSCAFAPAPFFPSSPIRAIILVFSLADGIPRWPGLGLGSGGVSVQSLPAWLTTRVTVDGGPGAASR